jgi:AcrR family transcriptional regulator
VAGGDRHRANGALVTALAAGLTVADAAARAGVSEATVYRRLRLPEFQREVQDARQAMLDRALGALADLTTDAARTLGALLESPVEMARLGAARAIIEHATKGIELTDLSRQVAELENLIAAAGVTQLQPRRRGWPHEVGRT